MTLPASVIKMQELRSMQDIERSKAPADSEAASATLEQPGNLIDTK